MDFWKSFSLVMSSMGLLIPLCVCAGFAGVFAMAGIVFYGFSRKARLGRTSAQSWPATQGTILSSRLKWRRGPDHRDEQYSEVIYRYEVNGASYQGQVVKAGEQFVKIRLPGENQEVVARYPTGATVTVYYNPTNPADAALER